MRQGTVRSGPILVFALCALVCGPRTEASTVFVDASAGPGGDGTSWATAFEFLQDGLAVPGATEIRVATGTYEPDRSAAMPGGSGLRTATFALLDGVMILGGYAGAAAPGVRDVTLYPTVLSGDLSRDDMTVGNGENSYHVVSSNGNNATAVIDGFTITAGNANGGGNDRFGAGVLVLSGDPAISACSIDANDAMFGAGVFLQSSDATIDACSFTDNVATQQGGGIYVGLGTDPTVTCCRFRGNDGGNDGGAMYVREDATIVNCEMTANTAAQGAAIYTIVGPPARRELHDRREHVHERRGRRCRARDVRWIHADRQLPQLHHVGEPSARRR